MKKIIAFIALILSVFLLVGCKSHKEPDDTGTFYVETSTPIIETEEPIALAVDMHTLVIDYLNNEIEADNKYKDKLIIITDAKVISTDEKFMILECGQHSYNLESGCYLGSITAYCTDSLTVSYGDIISIKGRFLGKNILTLQMDDATIVE